MLLILHFVEVFAIGEGCFSTPCSELDTEGTFLATGR